MEEKEERVVEGGEEAGGDDCDGGANISGGAASLSSLPSPLWSCNRKLFLNSFSSFFLSLVGSFIETLRQRREE